MFARLKSYNVILVTGPQRAGTTICSQMIAHDTGHTCFDEHQWGPHDLEAWRELVNKGHEVVIHCPTMCRHVHEFGNREDLLVVLLRRDIDDIIASQERIGWTAREEWRELARYEADEGPIAAIKYRHWWQRQAGIIKHNLEVEFDSLNGHPLWIPKRQRQGFDLKQTAIYQEGLLCTS